MGSARQGAATMVEFRAARLAVLAIFFLNGFGFASWVVRIPAIQQKLALSEGLLGLALLGLAVGALVSMPLAGWLVSRLGSCPVVGGTALLVSLALAPDLPLLFAALVMAGIAVGALDVSMNAQAVAVEKGYARPIMSSFRAAFSFGGLAGAASGGFIASFGVRPLPHFSAVAVLSAAVALAADNSLLPASADAGSQGAQPLPAPPGHSWGSGSSPSACCLERAQRPTEAPYT